MCGEQHSPDCGFFLRSGSSPRVRGVEAVLHVLGAPLGIIPTCAGSRRRLVGAPEAPRDHPRVCGEQWYGGDDLLFTTGSPPRVRGADLSVRLPYELAGIIPARAGSSSRSRPRGTGSWDHPRACGEQSIAALVPALNPGSSPRVRGAERRPDGVILQPGIIPAHAGSSLSKTLPSPE